MTDQGSDTDEAGENHDIEIGAEEYETERLTTRAEGAAALRRLAGGVANGSVELGEDEATVIVPERFELEIEYERESDEAELEVELEWPIVDGAAVPAERDTDARDDGIDEEAVEMDDGDVDEKFSGEDGSAADADADGSIDEVIRAGDVTSKATFELYRDRADEWRWRLVHHNGNIIADSGEGYNRKATARNGLESVMRNAPGATVVEPDD